MPLLARADVLERLEDRFATPSSTRASTGRSRSRRRSKASWPWARRAFVDQPHGGITSLGIRSTKRAPAPLMPLISTTDARDGGLYQGVDVWIADCLRRAPHPTHAHLDAVLGWARDLKVGQLLLTHLDNSMDYKALVASCPTGRRRPTTGRRSSCCDQRPDAGRPLHPDGDHARCSAA